MAEDIQGYHLSPQQERLWQLAPGGDGASVQGVIALRGPLDVTVLERAWQAVVRRHGILRTSFYRRPGLKTVLQAVSPDAAPLEVRRSDLGTFPAADREAGLAALAAAERREPWELAAGPLARLHLVGFGDGGDGREHRLLVTLSVLCADARSLDLIAGELATAYSGEPFADEEPVEYVELAAWQRSLLEDEDAEAGASWWRQGERGVPRPLELPYAAGGERSDRLERVPVRVGPGLEERFAAWPAAPEDRWLAAFVALLARQGSGGRALPVTAGVGVDARRDDALLGVVGPASRLVPVTVEVAPDASFGDLVARVGEARRDVEEWQDHYPGPGEAEIGFGFLYRQVAPPRAAGATRFTLESELAAPEPCPLALACRQGADGVTAELVFDPAIHGRDMVERLAEQLASLLQTASAAVPVRRLELLGREERRRLVEELNATAAPWNTGRRVDELFVERAAAAPQAIAVSWEGGELTYGELLGLSAGLAGRLRAAGVGPERTVAVLAERAPETVVAVLAALSAGGAFALLDPAQPDERLAAMLDELAPAAVLATAAARGRMPGRPTIELDRALAGPPAEPVRVPAADPDNLAYVLFTSGSTGRPKGVMVSHRALVNYLEWCRDRYGLRQGGAVPLHSALSFDLTLTSLLAPLVVGGSVRLVPDEPGVDALAGVLAGESFDLLKLTPSHLDALSGRLAAGSVAVGTLVVGGEALRGETLARWHEAAPAARVFNEYGPTEATVGCTVYELPPGAPAAGAVPIGRPLANARVYVVDDGLAPVAAGIAGEILVGGIGVARGYLGRPAETALRFVPDPLSGASGERLYRTGDVARFRPDGDLEFLGRLDDQVKVRGYRVEPAEVEAALAAHPAVARAVVAARDGRLVGWLVSADGERPKVDELHRFLAARLPEPMLPAAFVWVSDLPLAPSGKVDRRKLPDPGGARPELEGEYRPPSTPLEEVLAAVWGEVLGVDRVGVHDNFFSLGGDSIRSVRVVALAKERGLDLSVQDLFRHRTVGALAAELEERLGLTADGAGAGTEDLAALLDEIEGLSDDVVLSRLRGRSELEQSGA